MRNIVFLFSLLTTLPACGPVSLMEAAREGNTGKLKTMIEAGTDINKKNAAGYAALMIAAREGNANAVQTLLEAGADINLRRGVGSNRTRIQTARKGLITTLHIGQTALMIAAEKDHTNVVQTLLNAGADVDAKDKAGRTALMYAVQNNHTATVQFLLDAGANVNAKDRYGKTASVLATLADKTEVVELLNSNGSVNEDLNSKLLAATAEGNIPVMQALLDKGADVNAKDKYGLTALMIAAQEGSPKKVPILLEAGADVNVKSEFDKKTALTYAAEYGHTATVQFLLNQGADMNSKDRFGKTALMWAKRRGHIEIVNLIKQAGAKE